MKPQGIVELYNEWMEWPLIMAYYQHSGFLNAGYWYPDTQDQVEACHNLVDRLLDFLPAKRGHILDVACGNGATTSRLQAHYPPSAITGINISPRQLHRCQNNASECQFVLMDATRLGFPPNSFDAIICVEAAFHFNTRQQFLVEAQRILKPGGFLLLADIIYGPSNGQESFIVPTPNLVDNVEAYYAAFVDTGFHQVTVVDATTECWHRYTQNLSQWLLAKWFLGELNSQDKQKITHNPFRLNVQFWHYLLVAAQKHDPTKTG
jgi:ubiquinone/menaquinone biosynthesis C-methylase UbiE